MAAFPNFTCHDPAARKLFAFQAFQRDRLHLVALPDARKGFVNLGAGEGQQEERSPGLLPAARSSSNDTDSSSLQCRSSKTSRIGAATHSAAKKSRRARRRHSRIILGSCQARLQHRLSLFGKRHVAHLADEPHGAITVSHRELLGDAAPQALALEVEDSLLEILTPSGPPPAGFRKAPRRSSCHRDRVAR